MQMLYRSPRIRHPQQVLLLFCLSFLHGAVLPAQAVRATSVPLLLPGPIAYDTRGNLYFAETANHVVRRVDPTGILTTVAGTGTQGFAGDAGPATAALLDSPAGLAISPAGILFVADTHNHRIRRIDPATGFITTIAGTGAPGFSGDGSQAASATINLPGPLAVDISDNLYIADSANHRIRRVDAITGTIATVAGDGTQQFSGDGRLATAASIDSPAGLALDAAGNLFLADTHNHRIRRVDHATGRIATLAGTGMAAFTGDGLAASTAAVALPHGLVLDPAGNLYIADFSNHRIRRVDAVSGLISTVSGDGTQTFAGEGQLATVASLDTPRAVALSNSSLLTLADTGNGRVRQVDAAGLIHTIAGLGTTVPGTLALAGPTVQSYGTGTITATLLASPATGLVTFFDNAAAAPTTLAAAPLVTNVATLDTTTLPVGTHHLSATYPGDTLHTPAESTEMPLTIAPAHALAAPNSQALLFGQAIPPPSGTLNGILPQDAASVAANYSSTATQLAPPSAYPITATLTGTGAGNYTLTTTPASITIAKAPTTAILATPLTSVTVGSVVSLTTHIASTTSGIPTGTVKLLDGTQSIASAQLANGNAGFSTTLSLGAHNLTTTYGGDTNFLASTSLPIAESVVSVSQSDFTLAATGQTSVTVPTGTAAAFSFAVTPVGTALSSPILLTASGLPNGATPSFNPAYLPPGNTPQAFILTIMTPKASLAGTLPWVLAFLLPMAFATRRKPRRLLLTVCLAGISFGLAACGDRINTGGNTAATQTKSYPITVTATTTTSSGSTIQHTAQVTLNLQ